MLYLTAPQIARQCGCHRDKPIRLAKSGGLEGCLAPCSAANPSPVWLIPPTEANLARLAKRMPVGRPRKVKPD